MDKFTRISYSGLGIEFSIGNYKGKNDEPIILIESGDNGDNPECSVPMYIDEAKQFVKDMNYLIKLVERGW